MEQLSRIDCPLRHCHWQLRMQPPELPVSALAPMFGVKMMAVGDYEKYVEGVEHGLRAHFETHKLEEWVGEIIRLNDKLKEWDDHLC